MQSFYIFSLSVASLNLVLYCTIEGHDFYSLRLGNKGIPILINFKIAQRAGKHCHDYRATIRKPHGVIGLCSVAAGLSSILLWRDMENRKVAALNMLHLLGMVSVPVVASETQLVDLWIRESALAGSC